MGMPCSEASGSRVFRLTEREDMTTNYGVDFAKAIVKRAPPGTIICI